MTYFRINSEGTGQFERTLIIADKGSYVSYLEGCTAPMRKTSQLHAAVVELIALDDAEIKYSTLQNWYPGRQGRQGRRLQLRDEARQGAGRTPRSRGRRSRPAPRSPGSTRACILQGDNSVGEFYSVALVNNHQQADTGTKMIHIGKNTKSTIIAKGISAGQGENTYRGLVRIMPTRRGTRATSRAATRCCIGAECGAHTVPYIEVRNPTAHMEHEATTSRVSEDQLFYLMQRGIPEEDAQYMIINGFCKGVFAELPFEFAMEASQLLKVSLEGTVG